MSLYEAVALGANMSVPYGAWMGSVIQDSFNPPHELCVEIQTFLAEHENLFSHKTCSETAVVYSVVTDFKSESGRGIFADNRSNSGSSEVGLFWQTCESLSNAAQPYDVLFFPDGDLRADNLTLETLTQYRTIILPDCRYLTRDQFQLLRDYLAKDGRLLLMGQLGANLTDAEREEILKHPGTRRIEDGAGFDPAWLPFGLQLRLSAPADVAINAQRVQGGVAIHLLRYDYDSQQDQVPALDELNLKLRLPATFNSLEVFSPCEAPQAELETSDNIHHLVLRNIPLYSILFLKE
jgi:hypothetical protein